MSRSTIQWQGCIFSELSLEALYRILQLRQAVFVVEQDCPYLDIDDKDLNAWHLMAWTAEETAPTLCAYLRVLPPGASYSESSLGRILTASSHRRLGLGQQLMQRGLAYLDATYPGLGARISAQAYLQRFYEDFGFQVVSEPYDEDGIPHLEMLRAAPQE